MEARRHRRSTDNKREGLPPNLRHQRSSRSGRRCQKRQQPPRVTCGRVSSANRRPRRKSTTPGRKLNDAPKTPQTQQQSSTAGAGQATGARKVAEPPKGNLRQDTPRKTAGAAGRGTETTPERGSTIAYPAPNRRRERRHSSAPLKRSPHTHTDHQRGGPQLKPTKPATAGDGQAEGMQTELKKRPHHKRSQGIEAEALKFPNQEQNSPKLARKPRNRRKSRHIGNTAQGNHKNLRWNRPCNHRKRYMKNTGPNTTHT